MGRLDGTDRTTGIDSNICIHEGNAMNLYSSARKQ